MINSKRKGKTGELELAKIFSKFLPKFERSQQYKGATHSSDIQCTDDRINAILYVECKRCQNLKLDDWINKAKAEAAPIDYAVICHKKNHGRWMATLDLKDFLEMFVIFLGNK